MLYLFWTSFISITPAIKTVFCKPINMTIQPTNMSITVFKKASNLRKIKENTYHKSIIVYCKVYKMHKNVNYIILIETYYLLMTYYF